jgi:signal transduction histidine kinase/DNA-binding response OmpR family regulator
MNRQYSILIIDDTDRLPLKISTKLIKRGYEVYRVHNVAEGMDYLKRPTPPTFILADRKLETGPIEKRELRALSMAAASVSSEVLVYTSKDLSEKDRYEILNKGAYLVLDKDDVEKLVNNIDDLIQEFDEILQLMSELKTATSERSKFITALIGANVTLSFLDHNFRPRHITTSQERLNETDLDFPSAGICQNQCWLASSEKPASPPRCWGCTVAEVFDSKRIVETQFINRKASGNFGWVDVQSIPIKSNKNDVIIAVREAVTEASDAFLNNLTSETRLQLIAESLIRIGFGRARIYEFTSASEAVLRAAASFTDNPSKFKRDYFESIKQTTLTLDNCGYAKRASNSIGLFIDNWDPELGPSPLEKDFGLETPYFDVPVFHEDRNLCGWISVDFVGLQGSLREEAINQYARIESLTWLHEEYGREVRFALETTENDQRSRKKFEIVRRARFGIAGAKSVDDAIKAILTAFSDLLPKCRISIRILKDNELQEYKSLSKGTYEGMRPIISLDNPRSLAVGVVKSLRPNWIDDYPNYRQKSESIGEFAGIQPEGTQSTAQIPLMAENVVFGTLSISSPKPIKWVEERYRGPILELAQLIAWVLRDLVLIQNIDRAIYDRAAILAFSVSVSADGLWRHWAQQRLSEVSADIGIIRAKLNNGTLSNEELEDYLLTISGTIKRISSAQTIKDATQSSSIDKIFSRLQEIYQDKTPKPIFSSLLDYRLEMPEFVLRNVLMILLDNAIWSIQNSGQGHNVTVNAYDKDNCLSIEVFDDGPGIPEEMQESIFRDRVQSSKGQGLGLLYARGFALQYEGDLSFSSRFGETRFTLKLPLTTKKGIKE